MNIFVYICQKKIFQCWFKLFLNFFITFIFNFYAKLGSHLFHIFFITIHEKLKKHNLSCGVTLFLLYANKCNSKMRKLLLNCFSFFVIVIVFTIVWCYKNKICKYLKCEKKKNPQNGVLKKCIICKTLK